jgi:hypothetical protein
MPESDDAEIRRRRNELSCPETIGEISHIPRGDRDSATTFGGILDPLRGVISSTTFRHRIGKRLRSRSSHQIRMRRDWPIWQLDFRSRFGAFFSGKGHAQPIDGDCDRNEGQADEVAIDLIRSVYPPRKGTRLVGVALSNFRSQNAGEGAELPLVGRTEAS